MIWRVGLAICLTAIISLFAFNAPRAQFNGCSTGFCSPSIKAAAFTGIADVYANTIAHYGNRAASSARRGNKLWNVCDSATGLTCVDWSSDATTGLIVPLNVAGSSCTGVRCEIAIAYDDSGVNLCTSAACNLTAAHGSRPTVTLAGVNGIAIMVCPGGLVMTATSVAVAQPFTESIVAERTGSIATVQSAFAGANAGLMFFNNVTGVMGAYSGTVLPTSSGLTEGAFHSLQYYADTGASSVVKGDNQSNVTGNSGTTNIISTGFYLCGDGFGEDLTGAVAEAWLGTGNQTATFSAAHTNQSAAYGTP